MDSPAPKQRPNSLRASFAQQQPTYELEVRFLFIHIAALIDLLAVQSTRRFNSKTMLNQGENTVKH
jgi:hypothetical protein